MARKPRASAAKAKPQENPNAADADQDIAEKVLSDENAAKLDEPAADEPPLDEASLDNKALPLGEEPKGSTLPPDSATVDIVPEVLQPVVAEPIQPAPALSTDLKIELLDFIDSLDESLTKSGELVEARKHVEATFAWIARHIANT